MVTSGNRASELPESTERVRVGADCGCGSSGAACVVAGAQTSDISTIDTPSDREQVVTAVAIHDYQMQAPTRGGGDQASERMTTKHVVLIRLDHAYKDLSSTRSTVNRTSAQEEMGTYQFIDTVEGEHPHATMPRTTLHGCEPQP